MGWSFGGDKELFTTQEMIEHFDLGRIHLGGPVFDIDKLSWMNGHYMRALPAHDYVSFLQKEVFSSQTLEKIVPLIRDRIEKFEDFIDATYFFFSGDLKFDPSLLLGKGRAPADVAQVLTDTLDALESIEDWTTDNLTKTMDVFLKEKGLKARDVYMPLRVATTGSKETPPLFESIEVIGKEMVRRRVRCAVTALNQLTLTPEANGKSS